MERVWQDLRYAARMLAKSPGFTLMAVTMLALGIGANTAIFSVVDAVLLRPLPYPEPDRLVWMAEGNVQKKDEPPISVPPADFLDWKSQARSFEAMAGYAPSRFTIVGSAEPERVDGLVVTAGFFEVLRARPALGRAFLPEESVPGRDAVVVLSHGLWQRSFGGDPAVVGRSILLGAQPFTVIGVMPEGYEFEFASAPPDLLVPITFTPDQMLRTEHFLRVLGRLAPGVSLEQARAEMTAVSRQLSEAYPETNKIFTAVLTPLHELIAGPSRTALLVLLGAVVCVLSIAAANVANLLLARSTGRLREIAVRSALGATRGRIIRQLLTESLLLSLLGAGLGVLLAIWGVDLIQQLGPNTAARIGQTSVNGAVMAFTLGVSVLTGILFGLAPALQCARADLSDTLKDGGAAGAGPRRQWLRKTLMISEVALACVLLTGAGLLLNSFVRLSRVDPGFAPDRLLTLRVALPQSRYDSFQKIVTFHEGLAERLGRLPGVAAVAATTHPPVVGRWTIMFHLEGAPPPAQGEWSTAINHGVTPGYFRAMGIPLAAGRDFTAQDVEGDVSRVVVNRAFAARYTPGESPLGRRVKWSLRADDPNRPWMEIVGVVGDTTDFGLDGGLQPALYMPYSKLPTPGIPATMTLMVREAGATTVNAAGVARMVREEVRAAEPDAPLSTVTSMDEILSTSMAQPRFRTLLLGFFSGLALLLAAVGIYGVVSYSVAQRTQEIGIRMALGARSRDVTRLVLTQGLKPCLAGVSLGLVAAWGLTRLLSGFLFDVQPTDPSTFAAVSLLLTGVALAACWLPARRATRVDPMLALRHE